MKILSVSRYDKEGEKTAQMLIVVVVVIVVACEPVNNENNLDFVQAKSTNWDFFRDGFFSKKGAYELETIQRQSGMKEFEAGEGRQQISLGADRKQRRKLK